MSLDMLIPFGILFVLVIYLIYTRSKFEKDVVTLYEQKFEEWKSNSTHHKDETKKEPKELVGLVFKTGYQLDIELLDKKVEDQLQRGKFDIKVK